VTRPRRVLRAVAILACLPYLALKSAWVLGSDIGIPAGSSLLEGGAALRIANTVGVVMDAGVVVLALLLTRPWGLRVPTWLIILPMWVATGLLTPIILAFPAQTVMRMASGPPADSVTVAAEPFLAEWVFGVVYTGFILQGLTLGALFVMYARARWGHVWAGRLGHLPGVRLSEAVVGTGAAGLALLPLALHLVWATGGTAGLTAARAAERTRDFYAVEGAFVVLSAGAVVGLLAWLLRRGARLPIWLPVGLTLTASAGLAGWGGWLLTVALVNQGATGETTAPMTLTHLSQLAVGVAVLWLAARAAAHRTAEPGGFNGVAQAGG
jgi:hypothetical protein